MANEKLYHGLDLQNNEITGLPTPTADTHAATKKYVDDNKGASTATGVAYTPILNFPVAPNNPANTVQKAIDNLFTFANSGKTTIADTIGSPADSDKTFAQLAGYITDAKTALATLVNRAEGNVLATNALQTLTNALPNIRTFKTSGKLNKKASTTTTITLGTPSARPTLDKVLVQVFVRTGETGSTPFDAQFNNGTADNFESNDLLSFVGGVVKLKSSYTATYTTVSGTFSGTLKSATFPIGQFDGVSGLTVNAGTTELSMTIDPKAQIVKANGDITLTNVQDMTAVSLTTNLNSTDRRILVAMSFDGGTTWRAHSLATGWQTVNINSKTDFSSKGMTKSDCTNLSIAELETERAGSNTVRFAYYIENVVPEIDRLTLSVVVGGTFSLVAGSTNGSSANYTYNESTGVITINHTVTDSFRINYIDV